jgi:Fe-S-cluster containining protein
MRSGKCCEDFFLPIKPEELEASYRRWLANKTIPLLKNEESNTLHSSTPVYQDIHLIYPMVRFLRYDKEKGNHYRCVHHDAKSGNCGIYEIRPDMCRLYPYGGVCTYEGCKCKGDGRAEFKKKQREAKLKNAEDACEKKEQYDRVDRKK